VNGFKKGMIAYYGPGDTVTSFYAMVGERANYALKYIALQSLVVSYFK